MQMLINVTPSIISILDRAHFYNAKKTLFNHIKNIFLLIMHYLDIIYSLIVSIFKKNIIAATISNNYKIYILLLTW